MTVGQRQHITEGVPPVAPHRFGLRSVATFTQRPDGPWLYGVDWDENCGGGVNEGYVDCDPDIPVDFVKEPFDKGYNDADAFALYAMIECSLIGGQDDKAKAMAELLAGEDYGVERRLATQVLAEATDIVPAGAVSAKAALASLLGAWYLTSRIEPVIHMSPNVAQFVDFEAHGNHLTLKSGERVSIGAGYAEGFGGTTFDDYALFATGPVFGFYGTAVVYEAPVIVDNEHVVLAERPWLVGSRCTPVRVSIAGLLE
jgi:hypothetical protein